MLFYFLTRFTFRHNDQNFCCVSSFIETFISVTGYREIKKNQDFKMNREHVTLGIQRESLLNNPLLQKVGGVCGSLKSLK